MKKLAIKTILGLLLLANTQIASAMGFIYTEAQYPVTATGLEAVDVSNLKQGESSALNVLWAVEIGDAGIYKAAKEAGIKKIHFIDVQEKSVLIFFRKIKTHVYGE